MRVPRPGQNRVISDYGSTPEQAFLYISVIMAYFLIFRLIKITSEAGAFLCSQRSHLIRQDVEGIWIY
jgi:hypothetical protein